MKKLILFLFFCCVANGAQVWISETDITEINAGNQQGTRTFLTMPKCELKTGDLCFNTTGKDVRKNKVKLVREGPWEAPVNETDCADEPACTTLIAQPAFCPADPPPDDYSAFWGDRDGDLDLEAWCTRRSLVKRLKLDSALEATWNAVDAQEATDLQTRLTKFGQRDVILKDCVRVALKAPDLDPATATTNQLATRQNKVKECLAALAIEVISLRLELIDL